MFIDARHVTTGDDINADICIVGAGAAGITIALELAGKAFNVVVLEAGGFVRDASSQSLYSGELVGISTTPLNASRSRFFGGSTNCWGGYCRPLEFLDFQTRSWVPQSGWPLERQNLEPYFSRAHRLLQLGPYNFDTDYWNQSLAKEGLALFPLNGGRIVNAVEQMSPPARFGEIYRERLRQAPNIRTFLYANVTELEADEAGQRVERLAVKTVNGTGFSVASKIFVLAAGGIENPRLMLVSNRRNPRGIGNDADLVGRYFMDHPRFRVARLRLANQRLHRRVYDGAFTQWRRRLKSKSRLAAHIAPSDQVQARERLTNSRSYLIAAFLFAGTPGYEAAKLVRQKLTERRHYGLSAREVGHAISQSVLAALWRAPQIGSAVVDTIVDWERLSRGFDLETALEPIPNRDSRVTLSDSRDVLGVRKAKLDWRLTETDKRNLLTTHRILIEELEAQKIASRVGTQPDLEDVWTTGCKGSWHHIGTTRMSSGPQAGVVDANCRVHGNANLFIAGSSVFPTAGSDAPTLTIVALAVRLAEWICSELARPS